MSIIIKIIRINAFAISFLGIAIASSETSIATSGSDGGSTVVSSSTISNYSITGITGSDGDNAGSNYETDNLNIPSITLPN